MSITKEIKTPLPINISPLSSSDIPALKQIIAERLTDQDGQQQHQRIDQILNNLNGIPDQNGQIRTYFVAHHKETGEIVGCFGLVASSDHNLKAHQLPSDATIELVDLFVSTKFAGQKVSKQLFEQAKSTARSQDKTYIVLDSGPGAQQHWPIYSNVFGNDGVIIPDLDVVGEDSKSWMMQV